MPTRLNFLGANKGNVVRAVYAVLISIWLSGMLCRQASAIPADPAINIEEQGKTRVLAQYLVMFQRALLNAPNRPVSSDVPPFDISALQKANEEHVRQVALCKDGRSGFKTEALYADCLIAARRSFATAIGLRDLVPVEAIASTFGQVAIDTDSGRLTGYQALDIYDELEKVYDRLFGELAMSYDFLRDARLGSEYKGRFIKSFGNSAVAPHEGQPPLDDNAEKPAATALTKALETCEDSKKSPQRKPYADCVLAAEKKYADAVKLRDRAWYNAFEAALRAAVADVEAKRLTPAQFDTVAAWLSDAYSERISQQQSEYHALVAEPIAEGYAIRLSAAYVAVAGASLNDTVMPYDSGALDQADRDQREAGFKCQAQYKASASEAANLECYIPIYRKFAEAIKLRDAKLLEIFISGMRGVAADTDAGRLTKWQRDAVYDALSSFFNSAYTAAGDAYLAKHYRVVARSYLNSFDNTYFAAHDTAAEDVTSPPWDLSAALATRRRYAQSLRSCYDRRAELKTNIAYWDCRATVEKEFASATHRRDKLILETLLTTCKQAAADADAGRISAEQLAGIIAALEQAYVGLNESAWRAWHMRQQARAAAP